MSVGKILIFMIIATTGFSASAQKGVNVNDKDNPVKEYAQILELSESQVYDWTELNNYYDKEYDFVKNDESLSKRDKRKQLKKLRSDKNTCLLYTSPSPRDGLLSRMPSSA